MKKDGLEEIAERWLSEARERGLSKVQDDYWSRVFPLVKERFVEDNRGRIGSYNALILTLGTSPQPLILVLEALRPQKVYFLYTPETEQHLSRVIKEVDYLRNHEIAYDRDRIDADNPLELYEKVGRKWMEWSRNPRCLCALCNTGGKKSMVSASAVAAYFLGMDLIYVDHSEYVEDLRIPKPGTEYLTVLPNPLVAMGELKLKEAKSLFNAGNFEMSLRVLGQIGEELRGRYALPVGTMVGVLSELVQGYSYWDRFHYGKAKEKLESALRKVIQFDLGIDVTQLEKNLRALEHLSLEKRGQSLFSVLRDEPIFGFRLAVDLYLNSLRKAEAGLPDDAVVRLYRCLELVAQLRLSQVPEKMGGPFNTDNFEWRKLDRRIMARYLEVSAQIYKRAWRNPDPERMPTDVGLMAGHILLFSMGDPLWKGKTVTDLGNFHAAIKKRNELMLVHGKKRAADGDVATLASHAETFLRELSRDFSAPWDEVLEEHTYVIL
ncbi:MAG: TIGR02710 family CRISPR-associated protein [Actinobacteria bacterium]|nr:TIGR02710 family CRISPR-associated protein [Actinomycetota bacterium]